MPKSTAPRPSAKTLQIVSTRLGVYPWEEPTVFRRMGATRWAMWKACTEGRTLTSVQRLAVGLAIWTPLARPLKKAMTLFFFAPVFGVGVSGFFLLPWGANLISRGAASGRIVSTLVGVATVVAISTATALLTRWWAMALMASLRANPEPITKTKQKPLLEEGMGI